MYILASDLMNMKNTHLMLEIRVCVGFFLAFNVYFSILFSRKRQ